MKFVNISFICSPFTISWAISLIKARRGLLHVNPHPSQWTSTKQNEIWNIGFPRMYELCKKSERKGRFFTLSNVKHLVQIVGLWRGKGRAQIHQAIKQKQAQANSRVFPAGRQQAGIQRFSYHRLSTLWGPGTESLGERTEAAPRACPGMKAFQVAHLLWLDCWITITTAKYIHPF